MIGDEPSVRYYRAMHGRWMGSFEFALTDWRAFRSTPLSAVDRLRVLGLALPPRGMFKFRFDTRVDAERAVAQGQVFHWTWVSLSGVLLFRTEETYTLHPNGTDVAIGGKQWTVPLRWRTQEFGAGSARIDATADGASYVFPWLGIGLRRQTRVEGDALRVVQETPWSKGEVLLRRAP